MLRSERAVTLGNDEVAISMNGRAAQQVFLSNIKISMCSLSVTVYKIYTYALRNLMIWKLNRGISIFLLRHYIDRIKGKDDAFGTSNAPENTTGRNSRREARESERHDCRHSNMFGYVGA